MLHLWKKQLHLFPKSEALCTTNLGLLFLRRCARASGSSYLRSIYIDIYMYFALGKHRLLSPHTQKITKVIQH